jgi:hypothetical protein
MKEKSWILGNMMPGTCCEMDAVTFDDIEANETECVSYDDQCVRCGTVIQIRKADQRQFDKDPIQKLFAKQNAPKEATAEFRRKLRSACNIESKEPEEITLQVLPCEGKKTKKAIDSIHASMPSNTFQQISLHLEFLQNIVIKCEEWNLLIQSHAVESEQDLNRRMKMDILGIIESFQIKGIGGTHEPRQLLITIRQFLKQLAKRDSTKIIQVMHIFQKGGACFDGVISIASDALFAMPKRKRT